MNRWLLTATLSAGSFIATAYQFANNTALAQGSGVEIAISCGAVGKELEYCQTGAQEWARRTGNRVRVVSTPDSSSDRLALYQQNLSAGSSSIDVYQIDVVWPGILSQFFVDLATYIPKAERDLHFPRIIENNTVGNKLVGMPWFTDAGLLYYRTDLLQKYGFKNPPSTWNELYTMAKKIQDGERQKNRSFYGYVYQGNAYEGLTCNALEWISSFGGGTIVDRKGNITVNNPQAAQALNLFAKEFKEVSPAGVTTYQESQSHALFISGNAAFMRNWPYVYGLGNESGSAIRGKFAAAPLPKGSANTQSAATLGGWQLAVSRFSKNASVAADLVRYLTSRDEQKRRAMQGAYAPTIRSLYQDADVLKAQPFFRAFGPVLNNAVARPSTVTGNKYNQVSSAFWTAVHNTLTGRGEAQANLAALEMQLKGIKGNSW